ncbi:hypothetical protein [Sphingorhabdus sp. EL138]|uniref:hypothetical protein n=1 Tax=Sphingorhabdus sp. EL138 TaxID=2073156 RepID=UPI000D69992A|nr:hypothetical protein [Sphingorhabdus sp. EL138]
MSRLTLLLVFKIIFSLGTLVLPFLILPADRVADMLGTEPMPLLYKLYGVGISAILVGYASAIPAAQRGELPSGILLMGLVSNAGGALTLFAFQVEGVAAILGGVFAGIAFALLTALLAPQVMLRSLTGRDMGSV